MPASRCDAGSKGHFLSLCPHVDSEKKDLEMNIFFVLFSSPEPPGGLSIRSRRLRGREWYKARSFHGRETGQEPDEVPGRLLLLLLFLFLSK